MCKLDYQRSLQWIQKTEVITLHFDVKLFQRLFGSLHGALTLKEERHGSLSSISYMDIITTTEIESLNLERQEEHAKAEFLRHQVEKILLEE